MLPCAQVRVHWIKSGVTRRAQTSYTRQGRVLNQDYRFDSPRWIRTCVHGSENRQAKLLRSFDFRWFASRRAQDGLSSDSALGDGNSASAETSVSFFHSCGCHDDQYVWMTGSCNIHLMDTRLAAERSPLVHRPCSGFADEYSRPVHGSDAKGKDESRCEVLVANPRLVLSHPSNGRPWFHAHAVAIPAAAWAALGVLNRFFSSHCCSNLSTRRQT